jgi:subtilisin family serine protease
VAGVILYGNRVGDVFGGAEFGDFSDQLCNQVKIFSCKYFDPDHKEWNTVERSIDCVKLATSMKMDYVNYSGGGDGFNDNEYRAYKEYLKTGGTVVVAAGNEKWDLSKTNYYPASYSIEEGFSLSQKRIIDENGNRVFYPLRLIAVQNVDGKGELAAKSNSHYLFAKDHGLGVVSTGPDDTYVTMTGTSQAAPNVLHTILRHRCKELNR